MNKQKKGRFDFAFNKNRVRALSKGVVEPVGKEPEMQIRERPEQLKEPEKAEEIKEIGKEEELKEGLLKELKEELLKEIRKEINELLKEVKKKPEEKVIPEKEEKKPEVLPSKEEERIEERCKKVREEGFQKGLDRILISCSSCGKDKVFVLREDMKEVLATNIDFYCKECYEKGKKIL
ncbi:MAG TPA: hypothetical protein HA348_00925 [Thermoplasmata archaeon]|nr:hypothetical protein [Thermoplasmata archaeon]